MSQGNIAFELEIEMDIRRLQHATAITAAAMTLAWTLPGAAQVTTHAEHAAESGKLRLDNGRKWEPDSPLRDGMSRIRMLVEPGLASAITGKLDPAQYVALAARVEGEIGYIVANCKLAPEPDEVLHVILAEIVAGTEAMNGKSAVHDPRQGLAQVASAVNSYASHFRHPGFEPVPAIH